MIITTARKPSSKIRIFCKHLSRFTGWEYVTRGKTSLSAFDCEPFLLVGESRGNPGSLTFFSNGECVLYMRVNVSLDKECDFSGAPVIEGNTTLAIALGKATGLKMGESKERVIRVNDRIKFIDRGMPCIILKVLETRGEGIV